ncbi:hypothetical protein GGR93_003363 [Sulfitobacter noctilucicola]|uniref:Uncharacterized protein n=1 Tax=Sulfitobacter noctilucicola TaxID=1342301 RepID=A0A7W6Q769_9RHOB|nr:hypothetical protein [Sulfitobacter noctilucicola]
MSRAGAEGEVKIDPKMKGRFQESAAQRCDRQSMFRMDRKRDSTQGANSVEKLWLIEVLSLIQFSQGCGILSDDGTEARIAASTVL